VDLSLKITNIRKAIRMKIDFTWYLYDNEGFPENLRESWTKVKQPELVTDELLERLEDRRFSRPFYEVTLQCQLDTETLAVEIVSAS
jgi:hypothetical protein